MVHSFSGLIKLPALAHLPKGKRVPFSGYPKSSFYAGTFAHAEQFAKFAAASGMKDVPKSTGSRRRSATSSSTRSPTS